jgi:hypothetical protein
MTDQVVEALCQMGYDVDYDTWGMHNTIIMSIKKDGEEIIPEGTEIGYDDPREYLPKELVKALDIHFEQNIDEIKPGKNLYKVKHVTTEVYMVRADSKEEAEERVKHAGAADPFTLPDFKERKTEVTLRR